MTLKVSEIEALVCLGAFMAKADGVVTTSETNWMAADLESFCDSREEFNKMLEAGLAMDGNEAIRIVKNMGRDEKEYACAYLACLLYADRDVDDEEMKLWNLVTELCDLPIMKIKEAQAYMSYKH